MKMSEKTIIQFENITKQFIGKEILTDISGSILQGELIGLVGKNGSGKTTLLKIITGELQPDSGRVIVNGAVSYVPQLDLDLLRSDLKVFEFIKDKYLDWWDVLLTYENTFGNELVEDQVLHSLSGGEIEKLNISIALTEKSDLIIFDEPTNHLDLSSLQELTNVLKNTNKAIIIVSHNRNFLNEVTSKTWEIASGKLEVYGGNFDYYLEEKKNAEANQKAKLEDAKKRLKKAEKARQKEIVKSQRSQAKVTRMIKSNDKSIPKIVLKGMKTKGEAKHGQNKRASEASIDGIRHEISELRQDFNRDLYLPVKASQKSGLILDIRDARLVTEGGKELIKSLDLIIYHGDRIAIKGNNGSGKTTLTKSLEFEDKKYIEGEIKYGANYTTLFIDQKYDLVDQDLNLIENIQKFNPTLTYEQVRKVLGNMGFYTNDQILNKASTLSGGETARLTFAMVTANPVDLLILDEPTNNLDFDTVQVISKAIKAFTGSQIVISHDESFLEEANIDASYLISDKTFRKK